MNTEQAIAVIKADLAESIELKRRVAETMVGPISDAAALIAGALAAGNKVLTLGNGGSAADAQHLAAELMVRFEMDRRPGAAIALTTDTSVLTAAANDYGYEQVFARQVEALAVPGDVLVALSTSGKSPNVIAAARAGSRRGSSILALTGQGGGDLADLADICLAVPSLRTARIQEMHVTIIHLLCRLVEAEIAKR